MNNEQWSNIREDAIRVARNYREEPINNFLNEYHNIHETFMYEYDNDFRPTVLTIHTKYPGMWIGKEGSSVKQFKKILQSHFGNEVDVKFIEIKHGHFMSH